MVFTKSPLKISEQINQLQTRGLIIDNISIAEYYLKNVGYYRLSGYWWPFQYDKINHLFKKQSTFENVIKIYNFDRELRYAVFRAIESIEIAFRTKLIYYLSHEISPWWFEDNKIFKDLIFFQKNLASIDRELNQTSEIFIKEHYKKYYTENRRPPAWKTLEIVSFGTLSKLYFNLKNSVTSKNIIANDFETINFSYLQSWLISFAQIRNICAHHGRLWNKRLPSKPKIIIKSINPWIKVLPKENEQNLIYINLCCIRYVLNKISPNNSFSDDLKFIIYKFDNINIRSLGFNVNWYNEELWR